MNIRDYWPITNPPLNSPAAWQNLIDLRLRTFQGFAEKEAVQGVVEPKVNIHTSKGQEIVRILAFRVIEELAESYESVDPDHYTEELIDAFNYLLSMFLLGETVDPDLATELYIISEESFGKTGSTKITLRHIGEAGVILGAHLGDLLRNRAWMTHAQSTYFDGDLLTICGPLFVLILRQFTSWENFWRFYLAKDSVLQFRLRSNY